MALLLDKVATKNPKLLSQGIKSIPHKLGSATWRNYIRCPDSFGLGIVEADLFKFAYLSDARFYVSLF